MQNILLIQIAGIFILGALSQWLAWRLSIPSILLLLVTGVCVGSSGLRLINPDALLGPLLFPLVSVSVALILFEGGLSLRLKDLKVQSAVFSLISVGCVVSWLLTAVTAHEVFALEWELSLLLGAILTVSGPTVVTPLLRHIKAAPPLGQILKWEGILIDPVGALLSVFVFEIIWAELANQGWYFVSLAVLKTVIGGGLLGYLCARLLALCLERGLVPESLRNSFTVMLMLVCFVGSNLVQKEAGLLGVTVMGVVLGNMASINVKKILEFKENVVVFLISVLFILLAGRITPENWGSLPLSESAFFLFALIFIIRPITALVSTHFSGLNWRQRLFIGFLAPRGIVAAAVASLFALELESISVPNGNLLVPFTFIVIVGSVAFYGLFSGTIASLLGVRLKNPQGVLFVGASEVARKIARIIQDKGFEVCLIDTNPSHVSAAWLESLPAVPGSAVSEQVIESLELEGIGKLFAMTSNQEANALSSVRFAEIFGEENVYQILVPDADTGESPSRALAEHLRGKTLFGLDVTLGKLDELVDSGWKIIETTLSEELSYKDLLESHCEGCIPLFFINKENRLVVFTEKTTAAPSSGSTIISLVSPN